MVATCYYRYMSNTKNLPALKPNKYGTISRKALAKHVAAGLMEAKCEGHYTDDYAYDNANNFGVSDWKQAAVSDERKATPGVLTFQTQDFSSSYRTGYARVLENGTIRFAIHSNLSYLLRVKG